MRTSMLVAWTLFFVALASFGGEVADAEEHAIGPLPPSQPAADLGITEYAYVRRGKTVTIEVRGAEGAVLANLKVRWQAESGAEIEYSDPSGNEFFAIWHASAGYFFLEDLSSGASLESKLVDGEWQKSVSPPGLDIEDFEQAHAAIIAIIGLSYDDALLNLGLRQREAPKDPALQGCEGPPACDGQYSWGLGRGLSAPGCCLDARNEVDDLCRVTGPLCSSCCRYETCLIACSVLEQFVCSCNQRGRACGDLDFCDDDWPPPDCG